MEGSAIQSSWGFKMTVNTKRAENSWNTNQRLNRYNVELGCCDGTFID